MGMLVSYVRGYIRSDYNCDLKPSSTQRYLGFLCDLTTTSFRIPEGKLQKSTTLIRAVLEQGTLISKM